MKHTVEVTAEDIERGEHKSLNKCCVGLAVLRCLSSTVKVSSLVVEPPVDFTTSPNEDTALITVNDIVIFSTLDRHGRLVWKKLKEFDEGKPIKPFRFEIDVPTELLET